MSIMLSTATSEIGHTEFDGLVVSKRIRDYLRAAGIEWPEDQPPPYWGGGFLAWIAIRQGLTPPPNPIDPFSWRDWGHPRATPCTGSIVVLTGNCIGVCLRVNGDKVYVMHPVNGQVTTEAVSADRVIATRWPPNSPTQPANGIVHDLRVSIEHGASPGAAAMSAPIQPAVPVPAISPSPVIDHDSNDALRQQIAALERMIEELKAAHNRLVDAFEGHDHVLLKKDGEPIPLDDIALNSEVQKVLSAVAGRAA